MKQFISKPEEFAQDFTIAKEQTLMDSVAYKNQVKRLSAICERDNILKPWPHQLMFAPLFSLRKENVLSWTMGSGKSLTVLYCLHLLYDRQWNNIRPGAILIIAPKYLLKLTWLNQLALANLDGYADVINSEKDLLNSTKPIWLMGYSFLTRQSTKGLKLKRKGYGNRIDSKGKSYFHGEMMHKVVQRVANPTTVIMDESHKLIHSNTQRSTACRAICQKARRLFSLSGSPLDGYISSLAGVLASVYGTKSEKFNYTTNEFQNFFGQVDMVNQDFRTGRKNSGAGRLRKLPGVKSSKLGLYFEVVNNLMHRLTDADPLIKANVTWPVEKKHRVSCELSEEHFAIYNQLCKMRISQIRTLLNQSTLDGQKKKAAALAHINVLKQGSSCPWKLGLPVEAEDISKFQMCKRIVDHHVGLGEKVIIFIHQIPVGKKLKDFIEETTGHKVARIYAKDEASSPQIMNITRRESEIAKFQEKDEYKVLVASAELCSEGLNLIEAAAGVFYDYKWKSTIVSQAERRYSRPGQLSPETHTYYLEHKDTIDTYILEAILRKIRTNNSVLDLDFSALMWQSELQADSAGQVDVMAIAEKLIEED